MTRPLIDLHLHLEGSLPPGTLRALAARHGLPVPRTAFDGFRGFLRAFGAVCDLLRDREDFEIAARSVLSRARAIGVIHAEVLFSPQVFLRRGIALETILEGLLRARARETRRGGFSAVYIADGVRQWGPEWYERLVRQLLPWAGRGLAGIGLGGDERSVPATPFAPAFRAARAAGLRATIHAGEDSGPDSIRDALRLPVDRLGHGVRAAGDPRLMRDLIRRGITLEVCPGSNVATGVVQDLARHPLPRLIEAGVRVTLNSDDGAFFGTDAAQEMARAARVFKLPPGRCLEMTLQAAQAAFLPVRERAALRSRVLSWSRASGAVSSRARRTAG